MNTNTLITHNDPALGVGRLKVLGKVIDSLEEVGFESVHLYQDQSKKARSFIVALKSYESRAEWYSNEAEVNILLHQRIGRSESLKFFDAPTFMKYQTPPKSVETVFCRDDMDECNIALFDPDLVNIPRSQLSVGQSTMGEHSGRGIFAKTDIPKGSAIGVEKASLSYFIHPSTHRIMMELYEWAEENDDYEEEYVEEVFESVNAIVGFSTGYGFWGSLLGRTHSTVDSGLQMFCNHGCNGSYNYNAPDGFNGNEADIDLNQPPKLSKFRFGSPFNPALERNLRHAMTVGDVTKRDIKKGEEILCNYLDFIGEAASWEEDVRGLQGQCAGTELGDISSYEREKRM